MWLCNFLQDLILTPGVDDPTKMLCNNTNAIQFIKDPKFHRKHIMRHYYFMRDAIKTKEVAIKFLSTSKMIVDL